ncbi:hypothetical protein CC80DRAFT_502233 [Byssothecium circinans]|uniref:Uncharacterized protein n=1 Tax=Byssothecium circinans TaxID=147558 RepID=A0A6A5U2N6_9PLEO|nr:hypothetical protein CC80DRAFT_502233 [Byssothecium circinans]
MAPYKEPLVHRTSTKPIATIVYAQGEETEKVNKAKEENGVVLLVNGLLSLEKTPAHLINTVKRNSTSSPLLRLPAKIREQIWNLATRSQVIVLETKRNNDVENSRGKRLDKGISCSPDSNSPSFSSFHLTEACRQIYFEAGVKNYEHCIFYFRHRARHEGRLKPDEGSARGDYRH